jgi:hypothetical protein
MSALDYLNRIILALVTLAAGSMMTPATVFCVGPGNHGHLETVVDTSGL